MYTGDCPSILAHTYEWTLRFCMNAFSVQLRSFLLAGAPVHTVFVMSVD